MDILLTAQDAGPSMTTREWVMTDPLGRYHGKIENWGSFRVHLRMAGFGPEKIEPSVFKTLEEAMDLIAKKFQGRCYVAEQAQTRKIDLRLDRLR